MVSLIIDTEKQSVFHIDADPKWVQREFEGFVTLDAARYRMFSIRKPDCDLIAQAAGGKLIVPKTSRNAYVPVERRATQERLDTLEHAFLIQAEADGYRLTRYGESAALVIAAPKVEPESEPEPPVLTSVWFTIGGSHRQYQRDTAKIKASGIPARWVGPVAMGSKLQQVSVKSEFEAQMIALGFKKSRRQPLPPPKRK